eukprot:scaffold10018_cov72-Phaeocystis_antarctica.AAC.2
MASGGSGAGLASSACADESAWATDGWRRVLAALSRGVSRRDGPLHAPPISKRATERTRRLGDVWTLTSTPGFAPPPQLSLFRFTPPWSTGPNYFQPLVNVRAPSTYERVDSAACPRTSLR